MATVTRLVTCEHVTSRAPHTLMRVRRAWRQPREELGLFIEFFRADEAEVFDWSVRLLRGTKVVYESVAQMELADRQFIEYAFNLGFSQIDSKTYRVEVLIGGVIDAFCVINLGSQEADE